VGLKYEEYIENLTRELEMYRSSSDDNIRKKLTDIENDAREEAKSLIAEKERLSEELRFKDSKIGDLQQEIENLKTMIRMDRTPTTKLPTTLAKLHRKLNEASGKLEYKLFLNQVSAVQQLEKLTSYSFADLVGALTVQAKIIEERCSSETVKELINDINKERDEIEACLEEVLKREKQLETDFQLLSKLKPVKMDMELKEQSINCEIGSKSLISKVLELPMSQNTKLNDENNVRQIKSARPSKKTNKKPSNPMKTSLLQTHINKFPKEGNLNEPEGILNLKNHENIKEARIEKLKSNTKGSTQGTQTVEYKEDLSTISRLLEDLSAEHIVALTKLEQMIDQKVNLEEPIKHTTNENKSVKELLEEEIHAARSISILVSELAASSNIVLDKEGNLKEMKSLGVDIYKAFFMEGDIHSMNFDMLIERLNGKNEKFKSLFNLYEKLYKRRNRSSRNTKDMLMPHSTEDNKANTIEELLIEMKGLKEIVASNKIQENIDLQIKKYKDEINDQLLIIEEKDKEIKKLKAENEELLKKEFGKQFNSPRNNEGLNVILEEKIKDLNERLEEKTKANTRLEFLNLQLLEDLNEQKSFKVTEFNISKASNKKISDKRGSIVKNDSLSKLFEKIKVLAQICGITYSLHDNYNASLYILDVI